MEVKTMTTKDVVEALLANGETVESCFNKVFQLQKDLCTLIESINSLCDDVGDVIMSLSGLGIVCQLNFDDKPVMTLIKGGKGVEFAVKHLTSVLNDKEQKNV